MSNMGSSSTGVRLARFHSEQEEHVPVHWALQGVRYFAKSPSQPQRRLTETEQLSQAGPNSTRGHI